MIKIREFGTIHPLTIAAWIAVVSAPSLLMISSIFESNHIDALKNATWVGWSAMAYTAIMSSIVANAGLYFFITTPPGFTLSSRSHYFLQFLQ